MAKAMGVRARVRAELTAEIKASATRQLATEGASGLSLRAISRELDMASSAIYRYFASRDELLTALIIDAYDAVGTLVEQANAEAPADDHVGRFLAMAKAVRSWAISNPHEYALIYGSPVPGYVAPQDTVDPATRVPVVLLSVLVDRFGGSDPAAPAANQELAVSLTALLEFVGESIPAEILARGVRAWAEIFGLISLELFGHFENSVSGPADFFDHAMRSLADRTLG